MLISMKSQNEQESSTGHPLIKIYISDKIYAHFVIESSGARFMLILMKSQNEQESSTAHPLIKINLPNKMYAHFVI